jgi:1,4-dihydroxy-2-naphthoate octaprenyltransferase
MYLLGAGIARYLGNPLFSAAFWLGLLGVLMAQLSMNLLGEVFRPLRESTLAETSPSQRRALRDTALYLSIGALATDAIVTFILFKEVRLTLAALLCLGFSLLVIVLYSVPPLRLMDKGFGELALAIQMAYLLPAIGFLLQAGSFHRLLNAAIVPLTFLLLAALVSLDFASYADDLKRGRRTLLDRVGWQAAVPIHHGLLIAAYALLAAAPSLGFSIGLLWPAFLTLPFAGLQIYWLRNIALGAKPIWGLLTANALAVFGLTAYYLTLTFWLR